MKFAIEILDSTVFEIEKFPETTVSNNTNVNSYRKKNLFTNLFNNHSCKCSGFIFKHESGNVSKYYFVKHEKYFL